MRRTMLMLRAEGKQHPSIKPEQCDRSCLLEPPPQVDNKNRSIISTHTRSNRASRIKTFLTNRIYGSGY